MVHSRLLTHLHTLLVIVPGFLLFIKYADKEHNSLTEATIVINKI